MWFSSNIGVSYINLILDLIRYTVLKEIGDGCGEAALSVIKTMPNFIPAINENNETVKVYFNLPVKFRLDKSKGKRRRNKLRF